jgi:hypothetical protein
LVWDDREVVVAGDLAVPVVRAEGPAVRAAGRVVQAMAVDVVTVAEEGTAAVVDAGATGTEAPISRTG